MQFSESSVWISLRLAVNVILEKKFQVILSTRLCIKIPFFKIITENPVRTYSRIEFNSLTKISKLMNNNQKVKRERNILSFFANKP